MPDYDSLKRHLKFRLDTIGNTELRERDPELQLWHLQQASEAIQKWHQQNKTAIPRQLNHFLQQSSLNKALDFLDQQLD